MDIKKQLYGLFQNAREVDVAAYFSDAAIACVVSIDDVITLAD
jgi:hypothetical protein